MQDLSCVLPIYLLTPIQIHWAQCPCSHCTCLLHTPGHSPAEVTDTQGGKKLMLCRRILIAHYATEGTRLALNMTLLRSLLTTHTVSIPLQYQF